MPEEVQREPAAECRPGACPVIDASGGAASGPGCPCFPLAETALRRSTGPLAGVAHGSVVRPKAGGPCMSVLGFPAGAHLLLCGWLEQGRVRAEVFGPAQLQLVPAFGADEAAWLEGFRAHGTILHLLRSGSAGAVHLQAAAQARRKPGADRGPFSG